MAETAKSDERDGQGGSLGFGGFSEDRLRIDRIVERLDVTDDPIERADLGSELVRAASRYEDTFEQTLRLRLQASCPDVMVKLDQGREALRDAMDDIHQRTMGIDPRNVHASDGQGFEDSLTAVVIGLRELVVVEDRQIGRLVETMTASERQDLADEVAHVFRSASERPRPPRTTVGRLLSNAHVDHTLEDVSTPRHPGADTVDG